MSQESKMKHDIKLNTKIDVPVFRLQHSLHLAPYKSPLRQASNNVDQLAITEKSFPSAVSNSFISNTRFFEPWCRPGGVRRVAPPTFPSASPTSSTLAGHPRQDEEIFDFTDSRFSFSAKVYSSASGLWVRRRRTGPTTRMWRRGSDQWVVFNQNQVSWGLLGWASSPTPPSPTTPPSSPSRPPTPTPPYPPRPPRPLLPGHSSTWVSSPCLPTFKSGNLIRRRLHSKALLHQLPFQSLPRSNLQLSNPWFDLKWLQGVEVDLRMWWGTCLYPTLNTSQPLLKSLQLLKNTPATILHRSDEIMVIWGCLLTSAQL